MFWKQNKNALLIAVRWIFFLEAHRSSQAGVFDVYHSWYMVRRKTRASYEYCTGVCMLLDRCYTTSIPVTWYVIYTAAVAATD